jgi:hypothetical protein
MTIAFRSALYGAIACLAAGLLLGSPTVAQNLRALPPEGELTFRVSMSGSDIGRKTIRFVREGDLVKVETDISFLVRFISIPVYRYDHRIQETWRGGDLETLDSRTNDDGKTSEVQVRAESDMLRTTAGDRTLRLPRDARPSSYWHQTVVRAQSGINTQLGDAMAFEAIPLGTETVVARGKTVAAQRFKLLGYGVIDGAREPKPYLDLDLWYDEIGLLSHMKFDYKGFQFVYVLE